MIVKQKPQLKEIWKLRDGLAKPMIQRFEQSKQKMFYAPEWKIEQGDEDKYENYLPTYNCLTTPEKWEYYNKVKIIKTTCYV